MDAGMGPREQERELLHEAADAVGALMEFWGFKRVMGRIWALLYLRGDELSASELCDQLSISSGGGRRWRSRSWSIGRWCAASAALATAGSTSRRDRCLEDDLPGPARAGADADSSGPWRCSSASGEAADLAPAWRAPAPRRHRGAAGQARRPGSGRARAPGRPGAAGTRRPGTAQCVRRPRRGGRTRQRRRSARSGRSDRAPLLPKLSR